MAIAVMTTDVGSFFALKRILSSYYVNIIWLGNSRMF